MEINAKTAIEYSNWLNKWCEHHEYKKVEGGVRDGSHFISDEVLFDNFKMEKERNLEAEMYKAVTDVNDNIFAEIERRTARISEILEEAGYTDGQIYKFLKQAMYQLY